MDRTRKVRRELSHGLTKLRVLTQSVDPTHDDQSAKSLALQIREQAGICLDLLDQYQASVPGHMWSYAEAKCQPLRDHLKRTEVIFRAASGEMERRAGLAIVGNYSTPDFGITTGNDLSEIDTDNGHDSLVSEQESAGPRDRPTKPSRRQRGRTPAVSVTVEIEEALELAHGWLRDQPWWSDERDAIVSIERTDKTWVISHTSRRHAESGNMLDWPIGEHGPVRVTDDGEVMPSESSLSDEAHFQGVHRANAG